MIHRIFSDLPTFKEMHFRSGFNVVLSERSERASKKDTRNSTGKSSLIEILHFALGSGVSPLFRAKELIGYHFGVCLDLKGTKVCVARTASDSRKIFVDCESVARESWKFKTFEDRPYLMSEVWSEILGLQMFGLADKTDKYGPTFRSLVPYSARRNAIGEIQSATELFPKARVYQSQVALSYIFGLDWRISQDWQLLRDKEKALDTLRREADKGTFDELLGRTGEIQEQLNRVREEAGRLAMQIKNFRVSENYRELEQSAATMRRQIKSLSGENTLDEEYLEDLQAALRDETMPDVDRLEALYQEVDIALPLLVRWRFADVEDFHKSITSNRRLHLQVEIERCEARIQERRRKQKTISESRQAAINILETSGALDEFTEIQNAYTAKKSEVESLDRRLNLIRQLTGGKSELKGERPKLFQRLQRNIEDAKARIDRAMSIFREISAELYMEPGELRIQETENGPKFEPKLKYEGAHGGVYNMCIFCFDLTMAVLNAELGRGPEFLVHDSHLFDGVESRQKAKALEMAHKMSKQYGFQYIVLLNSDEVPYDEFNEDFDFKSYINPERLFDIEGGGLFGIRFEIRDVERDEVE